MNQEDTKAYIREQSIILAAKIFNWLTGALVGVLIFLSVALLGVLLVNAPKLNDEQCFVTYGVTPNNQIKPTDSKTCAYKSSSSKVRALGALQIQDAIKKGWLLEDGSWFDDKSAPQILE